MQRISGLESSKTPAPGEVGVCPPQWLRAQSADASTQGHDLEGDDRRRLAVLKVAQEASGGVLQIADLFYGLAEHVQEAVLSRAFVRTASKGTRLFCKGEPAQKLFLLERGRVCLREITEQNRDQLVQFVLPGEVFGYEAAMRKEEYRTDAYCDTTCRIYSWTDAALTTLRENTPQLDSNLFAIAMRVMMYWRERYRLLANAAVEQRVEWALRDLARCIGQRQGNTVILSSRALQRDVADLANTTIYSVSRVFSEYERTGVLVKRGRQVMLALPVDSASYDAGALEP